MSLVENRGGDVFSGLTDKEKKMCLLSRFNGKLTGGYF